MKFERNKIIKLNNNIEYIIVSIMEYNGMKYLYLARIDKEEFALVKLVYKDNIGILTKLENDEYKIVLNILMEKTLNAAI